jgi:cerevisin
MRSSLVVIASFVLAMMVMPTTHAFPINFKANPQVTPLLSSETAAHIPDHYIVMLRKDISAELVAQHHNWLSTVLALNPNVTPETDTVHHVYEMGDGLRGYAGKFQPEVIETIRQSPEVLGSFT